VDLSPNCRDAAGRPRAEHACTGCECACHAVAPPVDFRQQVERAREQAADG
jgi:hypothetical protein